MNGRGQVVGTSELTGGYTHAFLYDGAMHDLGTLLNTYFKVSSSQVPYYFVAFALGITLLPTRRRNA